MKETRTKLKKKSVGSVRSQKLRT